MIQDSPSKIYNHALPFSPSESWIHECYNSELLHAVQVVKGLQDKWGTCSRTVPLNHCPQGLAHTKDLIAVGLTPGMIIILDAVTGVHMSVLSEHTDYVGSLAFSVDGTFLVSGSYDKTIKLWDVQTGGAVKTFHGHTDWVCSVDISPDQSTIASGSRDQTICLWNTQTGDCCHVMTGQSNVVSCVCFTPSNSQLLISASGGNIIQQWDINGHKIGPAYEGYGVAFSSDGVFFVSWEGIVATVQKTDSGEVIAKLHIPKDRFRCCCFSPNGKFVAGGAGHTIYVWDISSSDPYLIETLVGHTSDITSLAFSSSLISSSRDKSIKFWQIGASTDSESISLTSAPCDTVSIQENDDLTFSSHQNKTVIAWDISAGLCKVSFHVPVEESSEEQIQFINDRLIIVWNLGDKWHIWSTEKGYIKDTKFRLSGDIWSTEEGYTEDGEFRISKDILSTGDGYIRDAEFRISGDGSMVFFIGSEFIRAWSIQQGRVMGLEQSGHHYGPCSNSSSGGWVPHEDLKIPGWNSGSLGPMVTPMQPHNSHLIFTDGTKSGGLVLSKIEDTVTKEVFRLFGKYAKPSVTEWNGHYLVAGYHSGEVLILDFNKISL